MNSTTLLKPLFLFYILLASSPSDLLGKQLKTFVEENRLAKHVIAYIALLTIIILYGNLESITQAIAYSLIGYAVFIMSTKLDAQWNIIIIMLLLASFLYESFTEIKEKNIINDSLVEYKKKVEIIETHKRNKLYISASILGVILIGLVLYNNKKIEQYGGGFDLPRFIFY